MSFPNLAQFLVACGFATFVLAAGHWFPWTAFLNGQLPRIPAYAYGVTTIWAAFAIWQYPDWPRIGGLLALCVVAGTVVSFAHAVDDYAMARHKAAIGDRKFGGDAK